MTSDSEKNKWIDFDATAYWMAIKDLSTFWRQHERRGMSNLGRFGSHAHAQTVFRLVDSTNFNVKALKSSMFDGARNGQRKQGGRGFEPRRFYRRCMSREQRLEVHEIFETLKDHQC